MSLTWFYHVSQQVSTHVHGQGIVPIESSSPFFLQVPTLSPIRVYKMSFVYNVCLFFLHALLSPPVESQCLAQGHNHPRTSMAILYLCVSLRFASTTPDMDEGRGTRHSGVSPISLRLICNSSLCPILPSYSIAQITPPRAN